MKKIILVLIICSLTILKIDANQTNSCTAMFDWNFSYSPISAYPIVYLNFKDFSKGNITSWQWSIDDSVFSTLQNPVYTVRLNTNYRCKSTRCIPMYNVCLKIRTSDGCESKICKTVTLSDTKQCEVKFNYSVIPEDSVITPAMYITGTYKPVRFFGISENEVVKWHWDFGDSTFSNERNPVHAFILDPTLKMVNCLKKGTNCIPTFNVCLTIVTADGCETTYCDYVTPYGNSNPECNSNFSYQVLESYPPQYKFKNESVWEGGTVLWSFGDGTYSDEENPTHVFSNPDSVAKDFIAPITDDMYTVCLTINSKNGCVSTNCQNIYQNQVGNLCGNNIKLTTSFEVGSSKCTGYAKAELIDRNGNKVTAQSYNWSNGSTTPEIQGICPNEPFKVFITNDKGCITRGEFVLSGLTEPVYIQYNFDNSNYNIEYLNPDINYTYTWEFCDGSTKTGAYATYESTSECLANLIITDYYGTEVGNKKVFLTRLPVNIKDNKTNDLKLFPVPADKKLNIQLGQAPGSEIIVQIIDLNGRLWISQKAENTTNLVINIDQLPKGAYICKVQTGNNSMFRKFIK